MSEEKKRKILEVFRKADRTTVYVEAAECTGWMIAEAQKNGLTVADGIQMAKQHYLMLSEVFSDWANNHLERCSNNIKPYIREVKE